MDHWSDTESLRAVLSAAGLPMPSDGGRALSAALDRVRRRKDIRTAALEVDENSTQNDSAANRKLSALKGQAGRIRRALADRKVMGRLDSADPDLPPDADLTALLMRLETAAGVALQGKRSGVSLGSPGDMAVKELARVAAEQLGIEPTVSTTNDPGGRFVDFAMAVFGTWGEVRTAASIKSALYR
jgi:hypothetical protein